MGHAEVLNPAPRGRQQRTQTGRSAPTGASVDGLDLPGSMELLDREARTKWSNCTITVSHVDARRVEVELVGRLDQAALELLAGVLDGQLRAGRRHVRVNLSRAGIADAAALAGLVPVHDRFVAVHGLLILDAASPELMSRLRLANLDRRLFVGTQSPPIRHPQAGRYPYQSVVEGDDAAMTTSHLETPASRSADRRMT